jgi:ribonuclease P protein component
VGFSVPKKKFKLSVDRHRIRRLMVEAWRLQKHAIYAALPADVQLHLFIVYTDKEMPTQELLMATMQKAIAQLVKQYGKHE